jgi:hypothetical protein
LRNVQFTLKGTDPFGEAYEIQPTDETTYPVYPYVDASQISVTVRAETVTPWSSDTKQLTARIIITNHSSVELTDVSLYEVTLGVINNYPILAAGETSFDQTFDLNSPRNLTFTVKGHDPTGTNRELANCVMPVAYGTETAAEATAAPATSGGNMTIFNGLSDGIAKILIVLGALMVFSFVILVVLTAMERSRMPKHFVEEDDLDDYFEPHHQRRVDARDYHDSPPNQEEISYTKRMLSMKDEGQFGTVNSDPVRLPPAPPPKPVEQPRVIAPPPPKRAPEQVSPRVDEVADRLVQTARSRYSEADSQAAYRPSSDVVKPYAPHPQQVAQAAAPRVFDYKKQPKAQPKQKQTVTRVRQSKHPYNDDEE